LSDAGHETAQRFRGRPFRRDQEDRRRGQVGDGTDAHAGSAIEGDLRGQPDADAKAGRREHQHRFMPGDVFGDFWRGRRELEQPAMNELVASRTRLGMEEQDGVSADFAQGNRGQGKQRMIPGQGGGEAIPPGDFLV
jgi:hypothetical protein